MMTLENDIEFWKIDSQQRYFGRCTALTGSTISLQSGQPVEEGIGMEILLHTQTAKNSFLTAYVETIKITKTSTNLYEIDAAIKIIKGN